MKNYTHRESSASRLYELSSIRALTVIGCIAGITALGDKVLFANVNEWFPHQAQLGQVCYDLSIGYLGAFWFYLLLVYWPDRRKSEIARPAIARRVTSIVHECRQLFLLVNQNTTSCNRTNITSLDRNAIAQLFSGLDLSQPSPKVQDVDASGNWLWYSWSGFLNSFRLETERSADELALLSTYYDAELLRLVDRIRGCEFFRNIKPPATVGHGELRIWSTSAYDYYRKVKDLEEYAKKNDLLWKWHEDLTPVEPMIEAQYPAPEDLSEDIE